MRADTPAELPYYQDRHMNLKNAESNLMMALAQTRLAQQNRAADQIRKAIGTVQASIVEAERHINPCTCGEGYAPGIAHCEGCGRREQ
jgi:hypothetical protein